jgi:hypothetical protein
LAVAASWTRFAADAPRGADSGGSEPWSAEAATDTTVAIRAIWSAKGGAEIAPVIPPEKRLANNPVAGVREILDGLLCILGTGGQWDAIPKRSWPKNTSRIAAIAGATIVRSISFTARDL